MLVEPFRQRTHPAFALTGFDAARDEPVETVEVTAPENAILVVSGPYLSRPEIRGVFHYSVYLSAPATGLPEADQAVEQLYLAEAEPWFSATATIDNTDPDTPRRSFSDSC